MFKFLKSLPKRAKKLAIGISTGAIVAVSTAIAACAEEVTSETSANGIESVINSAGATLSEQFTVLVQTLVPVLMSIAVVGLGLYACIYLFKMAKKFFAAASK